MTSFQARPNKAHRIAALVALASFHWTCLAAELPFDIPTQPLEAALKLFEAQAGVAVQRPLQWPQGLAETPASALSGRFEPVRALHRLLAGHPLQIAERDGRFVIAVVEQAQPATEPDKTLPAVTVTARRGAERAKDVPFSVSTVQGFELEQRRLTTLEEALRDTPGVEVNAWGGFGDANVRMRGVGSLYQVSSEDSSVVVNLDGTPLSARNASLPMLDVERVEVLKGPQGTLFGRNSEAGAINIVTRRPTREFDGYARVEAGQEGQRLVEGAVGGALAEDWSARIALRSQQSDDVVHNIQTGEPIMKAKELGLRASVLWQPRAATSVLLTTEHQDQKDKVGLMLLRPYGDPPSLDATPGLFGADVKSHRHALEVNHDLANARLTSHTSFQQRREDQTSGADRIVAATVFGMPTEYLKQYRRDESAWNQDLRLSSLPGAATFWVAGVNLYGSKREYDTTVGGMTDNLRDFETRSEAAYGEVTVPLAAALKLTGGLRYTQERKKYDASFVTTGYPATQDSRSLDDRYATGRVALSWALDTQTNLYGVLAHGHKAKGFQDETSQVADGDPFKAAKVDSLELGLKFESADRRLAWTTAAFLNRVRDDHMLGYDYTTFATKAINADTRTRGLEVEGQWRAAPGLTLKGGAVYTDATITQSVTGVSGGDVAAGNRVPDVPRWSGKLSVNYTRPLPGFMGLASPQLTTLLAYRVMSTRANDPQNHIFLPRFQKIDARIGIASGAGELYLWVDNLQDKRYDQYVYYFTPNANVGMPTRGRTVGLGFTWQFF